MKVEYESNDHSRVEWKVTDIWYELVRLLVRGRVSHNIPGTRSDQYVRH